MQNTKIEAIERSSIADRRMILLIMQNMLYRRSKIVNTCKNKFALNFRSRTIECPANASMCIWATSLCSTHVPILMFYSMIFFSLMIYSMKLFCELISVESGPHFFQLSFQKVHDVFDWRNKVWFGYCCTQYLYDVWLNFRWTKIHRAKSNRLSNSSLIHLILLRIEKSAPSIPTDPCLIHAPLVIIIVGLPFRGKSMAAHKLARHLNWKGDNAKGNNWFFIFVCIYFFTETMILSKKWPKM